MGPFEWVLNLWLRAFLEICWTIYWEHLGGCSNFFVLRYKSTHETKYFFFICVYKQRARVARIQCCAEHTERMYRPWDSIIHVYVACIGLWHTGFQRYLVICCGPVGLWADMGPCSEMTVAYARDGLRAHSETGPIHQMNTYIDSIDKTFSQFEYECEWVCFYLFYAGEYTRDNCVLLMCVRCNRVSCRCGLVWPCNGSERLYLLTRC